MTTINVRGLAQVDANLQKLGQVAGQKAMRSALFAASKPILDEAKQRAAKRSGALSVATTRFYKVGGLENSGSRFTISIGPKAKNRTAVALFNLVYKPRKPRRGIFYGHLQEFSHRDRAGGEVAARPYLLPALRNQQARAVDILSERLRKKIEQTLPK